MKSRRANAVLFGFDFQRNAAIVLMLENIKDLRSVRLEGNEEDIELTLENGRKLLAQAKAIEKSSSDFTHVRENLKKALVSLSEGAQKTDAQQLIFITNSPNPFNDEESKSVFGGLPTRRSFSNLPPSAQEIVQRFLGDMDNPLDLQKLMVQVFPFETDDETERYKAITQAVNDFIGSLNVNVSYGLGKWLLQVWHDDIFINGSKRDASIQLDKKDIIWPILVYETDINRCDEGFLNQFDIGVYDEVVRLYSSTIDSCCERIEFFTKILYDYTLKELSGAVLHKTVFAFRLTYIAEFEKHLGIRLPIILDSPSGKEVDQANIQLMVNILKRDFSGNQIIIASIFQYDFETVNTIEIVNRLIEDKTVYW